MTQPNDLPPLPEPQWLSEDPEDDTSPHGGLGHTPAQMTAYGLQCAEAAVERERARIIAGLNKMSAQCRELHKKADQRGDSVGARCMTNRLQELAMVYGLVDKK